MTHQTSSRKKTFEAMIRRIQDIPSLPEVVNRIIEMLSEPGTPASQIAELISYDPGLTSKVLRMVNSSAYGFQRQISSVQHGIMILGFNTVRSIVLSASIFKMFKNQSGKIDPNTFWKHSLLTAVGSRLLAERYDVPYQSDAFSAGMLHDIGKVLFDVYFAHLYKPVMNMAKSQQIPFHGKAFLNLEEKLLETTHAELGYLLALRWKFPSTLCEAIRCHHKPNKASDAKELVHCVAMANEMSKLYTFNYGVFDINKIPEDSVAFFAQQESLDVDNEDDLATLSDTLETVFHELVAEMDNVEELLQSLNE